VPLINLIRQQEKLDTYVMLFFFIARMAGNPRSVAARTLLDVVEARSGGRPSRTRLGIRPLPRFGRATEPPTALAPARLLDAGGGRPLLQWRLLRPGSLDAERPLPSSPWPLLWLVAASCRERRAASRRSSSRWEIDNDGGRWREVEAGTRWGSRGWRRTRSRGGGRGG
jgi:hypothetical protein